MQDSRLWGTWRSDKRRTYRELSARADIPDRSKRALRRLFGRLELRYTRKRCYATLDGHTDVSPYQVVAKDQSSVAIITDAASGGGAVITHIHFEGRHYWINVGTGLFREFFRRTTA